MGVCVGRGVRVGVAVRVGVGVSVGVFVGIAVGGTPSTSKKPETFQFNPVNICTSYVPGSQSCGSGSQSVKPNPPVSPSQGRVS